MVQKRQACVPKKKNLLIVTPSLFAYKMWVLATILLPTTLLYLLEELAKLGEKRVVVIETPNLAGRSIEGSILPKKYESFVGVEGLVHRHGLSICELALFHYSKLKDSKTKLVLVYNPKENYFIEREDFSFKNNTNLSKVPLGINPSPNIPSSLTCHFYSGQCLLEGTNLSEGRGTTRPFETFGAPYLAPLLKDKDFFSILEKELIPFQKGVIIRPLIYIPTFHKYSGEHCYGFQLHLAEEEGGRYHSLLSTLVFIKFIRERFENEFCFREEEYEFCSDKPAIDILLGDDYLLSYIKSEGVSFREICEYLKEEEEKWFQYAKDFLVHPNPLRKAI